jgi:hypothetical protein
MCSVSSVLTATIAVTKFQEARTATLFVLWLNLSPERLAQSVLRESPLVDELTVSGEIRHSSWVTPENIVVVSAELDSAEHSNVRGMLNRRAGFEVCGYEEDEFIPESVEVFLRVTGFK